MSDDLIAAFDSVVAEGVGNAPEVVNLNGNRHMGDDLPDFEAAAESTDILGIKEDDSDGGDDSEISETDEVSDDQNDDALDTDDELDATDEAFDFDSIKEKPVKVTVNGETFEVPLSELRNGYMRQSDYTRKTQQVAADMQVIQWARELQEGFRADPQAAIEYLASQFGVKTGSQPDPWQALVDEDPTLEPLVTTIRQQEQSLNELRRNAQHSDQERMNAQVQSELNDMKSKYSDFDPQQVLPIAIENGLNMEKAYKLWKVDQLDTSSAAQEEAAVKAAAVAAAREKARSAQKKVSSSGASRTAAADDGWKKFDSFEELFEYESSKRT
jgi:hypothetical protein